MGSAAGSDLMRKEEAGSDTETRVKADAGEPGQGVTECKEAVFGSEPQAWDDVAEPRSDRSRQREGPLTLTCLAPCGLHTRTPQLMATPHANIKLHTQHHPQTHTPRPQLDAHQRHAACTAQSNCHKHGMRVDITCTAHLRTSRLVSRWKPSHRPWACQETTVRDDNSAAASRSKTHLDSTAAAGARPGD